MKSSRGKPLRKNEFERNGIYVAMLIDGGRKRMVSAESLGALRQKVRNIQEGQPKPIRYSSLAEVLHTGECESISGGYSYLGKDAEGNKITLQAASLEELRQREAAMCLRE